MARYTGPRRRIVRRLGVPLHGLTRRTADERPYPPGQHGPERRQRLSGYAVRLREKQKLRYYYGVTERQLRNYSKRAARRAGPRGGNLLRMLERRLDNVVFRLGLAPTIPAARQLVRHGHVTVNGRRVSMPAFELRVGDVIGVRERSREHQLIRSGSELGPEIGLPQYVERATDGVGGKMVSEPERSDIPLQVDETMIVEFYAR